MIFFFLACLASSKDDNDPDTSDDTGTSEDTGPPTWATGKLSLHMIDVGQGDGLLLIGPTGRTMVVDIGDEDAWWDHTETYLGQHAPHGINLTVVSHQHSDHLGAMDRLLDDHPEVEVAFDNGRSYDSADYDWYVQQAADRRQKAELGDFLPFDPEVTVEVIHGDVGDNENENNNSLVLKVTFGAVKMMLGGDCESWVCERELEPGAIDIYKVHHHGSSDSTDAGLLAEMAPSHALIPVGRGNDYGHPHDETLDKLDNVGAQVWRSDQHGDVVLETDGTSITVTTSR